MTGSGGGLSASLARHDGSTRRAHDEEPASLDQEPRPTRPAADLLGLGRLWHGNQAESTFRHLDAPLLLIKPDARRRMAPRDGQERRGTVHALRDEQVLER